MSNNVQTSQPSYYTVIFTSERTEVNKAYLEMAEEMVKLAWTQPGSLGVKSVCDGLGIMVSYWDSLEAIQTWKQNERRLIAQRKGIVDWYSSYKTRICKVERDYGFNLKEH